MDGPQLTIVLFKPSPLIRSQEAFPLVLNSALSLARLATGSEVTLTMLSEPSSQSAPWVQREKPACSPQSVCAKLGCRG